jgi:bacterioferritin-associated ferredoxin
MHTLLDHARDYARAHGVELAIIDVGGPPLNSYMTARAGPVTILGLSSATAHGSQCGYIVYFACEAIEASRALEITVRPIAAAFRQRLAS